MPAPVARWMFGDSGSMVPLGSRRLARRNPFRWSCRKQLDQVCAELARCGPELRARPVRVDLCRSGEASEKFEFNCAQDAVLYLRKVSQSGTGVPENPSAEGGSNAVLSRQHSLTKSEQFRYEDRSKIPDDLLAGPFERFEISEDVYSTAYLIARNATEDMYSIWPWVNPQVGIVWLYLFFIVGSQLFVIVVITIFFPPNVDTEVLTVDCANATMLASLVARGAIEAAEQSECEAEGKFAFLADVRGTTVAYHTVELSTPFYDSVLTEGSFVVYLLRFVCCSWVFSQMYFQQLASVRSLIEYHDFSKWFLPLKGMEVRNSWASGIAVVQYSVVLIVTTVSFVIIFAQRDPFDIVMNSLAFTFIAEVGSYFNSPLVKSMAATKIAGLPESYGDIFYLYAEYQETNAIREDGTYTDEGWYILQDEEKAGLLSDYEVKHNPDFYDHPSEWMIILMRWVFCTVPALVTLAVGARSRGALAFEL